MHLSTIVATVATLATCLQASRPTGQLDELHALNKRQSSDEAWVYEGPFVPSFNISIPVDHFNESDTRTYNNRYWINDTFYQPGGPVFFFDYGELGVAEQSAATWLAELNGTTSVMALARQYNGLAILWEHRYYGLSQPIPFLDYFTAGYVELEGGPEGWSYLTIEQALEDVAYFANNLQTGGYQSDNISALAPSNTPWIWIGASYPGERGAWARIRNPEVIYATWSSAAPVQDFVDGSLYFNEIERSLPSNCTSDVRAIIAYADQVMSGDHTSQEYIDFQRYMFLSNVLGYSSVFTTQNTSTYNLSDAEYYDDYQIAYSLRDPFFGYAQAYGPALAQGVFCNFLETFNPEAEGAVTTDQYVSVVTNPGDAPPSAEGFLTTHDNNLTLGLQAMAFATGQYQNYTLSVLSKLSQQQEGQSPVDDIGTWIIQVSTELGWYQGSNPANITIVSSFINYTAVQERYTGPFFSENTTDLLPAEPDLEPSRKYGGWNMNPSNVMFTAGEFDPWRVGTVFSREADSPGNQVTIEVPACGVPPQNGTRYGAVFANAAHGWDLRDDESVAGLSVDAQGRSPGQAGLELFTAALDVWLPCFNESAGSGNVTAPGTYTGQASVDRSPTWMFAVGLTAILAITML